MHLVQEAQVEVGVECLAERVVEGVQVRHALSVVEGHQPALVIQVDADPGQRLLQREHSRRRRAGHVLDAVRQRQRPEAVGGQGLDDALAGHGLARHADRPHGAAVDLYLPIVAPMGEALAAQQRQRSVEALGVV